MSRAAATARRPTRCSYATLDDIFTSTIGAPTGFTDLDVSPDFRIAGFTYDPGGYRVLVESRSNTAAPNEVYLASYGTLDDLFGSINGSPSNFTNIDVAADFRIGGFAAVTTVIGDGGVPEPATWAMMLLGFFGLGAAVRRSRPRLAGAST